MSAFYAMPYGGYSISGSQGTNNIKRIYDYLHQHGYSKQCIIGICGNIVAESSLNPWLWENNTVNYNKGYGLLQFTPASEYINATGVPNHAPNLSTSEQTQGADPDDALGQLYCLITDRFGKWVGDCWRRYWDRSEYPTLSTLSHHCLDTYGNGSSITMAQFKGVDNFEDACFIFLACYEGPLVPNYYQRLTYCRQIKSILDNYGSLQDILFLKRFIIDRQNDIQS